MTEPAGQSADDIAQALAIATRVHAKAIETLAPLEREMTIAGWKPDYRAIMWQAVAREAMLRSLEAARG